MQELTGIDKGFLSVVFAILFLTGFVATSAMKYGNEYRIAQIKLAIAQYESIK